MENLNAEQVKKALECCVSETMRCEECPRYDACREGVGFDMLKWSLALINSQEQRIKELAEENERLKAPKYYIYSDGRIEKLGHDDPPGKPGECGLYKQCQADTVRKMHFEIQQRCIKGGIYPAFVGCTVDKVAYEMTGDEFYIAKFRMEDVEGNE